MCAATWATLLTVAKSIFLPLLAARSAAICCWRSASRASLRGSRMDGGGAPLPGFFFGGGASLEARHTALGATAGMTSFGPELTILGRTIGAGLDSAFGADLAGAFGAGLAAGLATGFAGAAFAGALAGALATTLVLATGFAAGLALAAGFGAAFAAGFFTGALLLDFAM